VHDGRNLLAGNSPEGEELHKGRVPRSQTDGRRSVASGGLGVGEEAPGRIPGADVGAPSVAGTFVGSLEPAALGSSRHECQQQTPISEATRVAWSLLRPHRAV
jgi:hypothetical protein